MAIFNIFKNNIFWLILLAFGFGVLCRLEWVFWASDFAQFVWDGELMISTNDGYAFAEGARDMLAGFHQPNDLSFYGSPLSALSAFIVGLSGIRLESVMIYLSAFLSPLIVVPLVLLGRDLGVSKAGAIAAFVAVVANSYYNRTLAGYYDTDMLTITLPCFILWGLVRICVGLRGYFIAPIAMLVYYWWYPSSITLNLAIFGAFVLYVLLRRRSDERCYFYAGLMLLALCSFSVFIKLGLFVLLFIAWQIFGQKITLKIALAFSLLALGVFAYFGGLDPIWFNLKFYLVRSAPDNATFHFFNVNQTIMESGIVPFDVFCKRISSSVIVFCLSLVGYAVACYFHPALLLTLPMTLLGFLALKGGLRFTIYAVPFMAFGFGYFVCFVYRFLNVNTHNRRVFYYVFSLLSFVPIFYLVYLQKNSDEFGGIVSEFWLILAIFLSLFALLIYRFRKDILAILAFMAISFALTPSLVHIYNYKPLSVFAASEVNVLNQLKSVADPEDYALAWWDYGYAVRFYSDVKTLIDGGKHLGSDNFAVSKALISPQRSGANMARLEVEYTERNFKERFGSNLAKMMKDYNASDVNEFLLSLESKDFKAPKASRDVYFVLPDRMEGILSVIPKFSMLDLNDGKSFGDPIFYSSQSFRENGDLIEIGNNLALEKTGEALYYEGQRYSVNTFIKTKYENGKLSLSSDELDPDGGLFVIYMSDYARFLVMDATMFASTYIQLFVLENYDKEIFEPVILDPAMKVYKLKF